MKRLLPLLLALTLLWGCAAGPGERPTEPPEPGESTETGELPEEEPRGEEPFGLSYSSQYGLNPYLCTSTGNRAMFSLLYESLFTVSNQFRAEPLLCDTFTVSEDGRTYRFQLVEGVRFADGSPLTAEDVVASIDAARKSPIYGGRLAHIWGVTAEEPGTVVVVLGTPYENFCVLLDVPVVKASTVEMSHPLGTGPYTFRTNGLIPNEHWWAPQPCPIEEERILLNYAEDPNDIRDHFEFGGTTLVYCDPNSPAAVGYRCDYEVWEVPTTVFHFLGFNEASGYFANGTLRRGITWGLDRPELINQVYGGYALGAMLPCSPQSDLYDVNLSYDYDYDAAAFRAAVQNSGVLTDPNYRDHTGIFLVCSEDPTRVTGALAIAELLREAGLRISVNAVDRQTYRADLRSGNFDLYYGEARLTSNFDLSEFFREDGNMNYGSISDPGLATLCVSALANSGDYMELCRQVMDKAPICPLVFKSYAVCVARGRVESITPAVDLVLHNSVYARTLAEADRTYEAQEETETAPEASEPTESGDIPESTEPSGTPAG